MTPENQAVAIDGVINCFIGIGCGVEGLSADGVVGPKAVEAADKAEDKIPRLSKGQRTRLENALRTVECLPENVEATDEALAAASERFRGLQPPADDATGATLPEPEQPEHDGG